jgi:hypothetical protein
MDLVLPEPVGRMLARPRGSPTSSPVWSRSPRRSAGCSRTRRGPHRLLPAPLRALDQAPLDQPEWEPQQVDPAPSRGQRLASGEGWRCGLDSHANSRARHRSAHRRVDDIAAISRCSSRRAARASGRTCADAPGLVRTPLQSRDPLNPNRRNGVRIGGHTHLRRSQAAEAQRRKRIAFRSPAWISSIRLRRTSGESHSAWR